jgi:N-methylhydantoinase B
MRRTVRALTDDAVLSLASEKHVVPPYGLFGGTAAWPIRTSLRRGEANIVDWPVPGKVASYPLRRDDVVVMETNGGGGYGDPLTREPARVLSDLSLGYITSQKAQDVYGVVISNGAVHTEATAAKREALRKMQMHLTLTERLAADDANRFPSCWLNPAIVDSLALTDGDLVELVAPDGPAAPIRLAVASETGMDAESFAIPAPLRAFFGLTCGRRYWLRAPSSPAPLATTPPGPKGSG